MRTSSHRAAALRGPLPGPRQGTSSTDLPWAAAQAPPLAPAAQPEESMRPRWRGCGVGTLKVRRMLDISLRSRAPETQSWTCSRACSTASWTPTKMASRPASQCVTLRQDVSLLHNRHVQGHHFALHNGKLPPRETPQNMASCPNPHWAACMGCDLSHSVLGMSHCMVDAQNGAFAQVAFAQVELCAPGSGQPHHRAVAFPGKPLQLTM